MVIPTTPGETPLDDVSGLLVPLTTFTRRELSVHEARNIAAAVGKYLGETAPTDADAPFDFSWLLAVHAEMFGNVWQWAGRLRTTDLSIGVPWPAVETRLYDLSRRLPYWTAMPSTEVAARLHHELVFIHPFTNGNGRWARLVSNIWQVKSAGTVTYWPEEAVGEVSPVRAEYVAALKAADAGNISPLLQLHELFTIPFPGS